MKQWKVDEKCTHFPGHIFFPSVPCRPLSRYKKMHGLLHKKVIKSVNWWWELNRTNYYFILSLKEITSHIPIAICSDDKKWWWDPLSSTGKLHCHPLIIFFTVIIILHLVSFFTVIAFLSPIKKECAIFFLMWIFFSLS